MFKIGISGQIRLQLKKLCAQSQVAYEHLCRCATLRWTNLITSRSRKPRKGRGTMVQQLRKSITTLIFLVSGAAWAQAPTAPLAIKPDAPDRYIVVPGDTLWGISQRYTDSPWRWPELWNMNREQIRNPHLIYPGYVLILDRERGQLRIAQPGTPSSTQGGEPREPREPDA